MLIIIIDTRAWGGGRRILFAAYLAWRGQLLANQWGLVFARAEGLSQARANASASIKSNQSKQQGNTVSFSHEQQ